MSKKVQSGSSCRQFTLFFMAVLVFVIFVPYVVGHEIVGWGLLKTPNTPLTNVTKISAGNYHGLALKSDGTLAEWGCFTQAAPPVGTFTAIASNEYYNLALKLDGSIVGWGSNEYDRATPPAGYNFIAIAAGGITALR